MKSVAYSMTNCVFLPATNALSSAARLSEVCVLVASLASVRRYRSTEKWSSASDGVNALASAARIVLSKRVARRRTSSKITILKRRYPRLVRSAGSPALMHRTYIAVPKESRVWVINLQGGRNSGESVGTAPVVWKVLNFKMSASAVSRDLGSTRS